MQKVESPVSVNLGPLVPAIALVLFCIFYIQLKSRKTVRVQSPEVKQARIDAYESLPLIDGIDLLDIDRKKLDVHQPDENDPDCLNLAKVNFFNLLNNSEIKKEAEKCIRSYGVGSCGPRGFYGTIDIHLNLESKLAQFMGMEETVLYSYGFSTISSAIGAYCKKSDIIFCDEKISFAAKQGFLAAKSKIVYFKHNNMEDLEVKLTEYQQLEAQKKRLFRKFLIVEGIYETTGTICPLPELMKLRKEYKLRIFIDESLSFGVLGATGRGVTEYFDVDRSDVDMIMGSLEGSIGSIGGFCVGASIVIEHQRLSGLGYCFSASLPPFLSHISIYVLDLFEKNPKWFSALKDLSTNVDKRLRNLTYYEVLSDPQSPLKVISVRGRKNSEVMDKIHSYCESKKMYLTRWDNNLHLNLNIDMTKDDINKIITILEEASKFIY